MAVLLAGTALLCLPFMACSSADRDISPVIYAEDDQAAHAMRSAPIILVVKLTGVSWVGSRRDVEKPAAVGGPVSPTIPLQLARIRADVLLTVRGSVSPKIDFYSWVFAGGKHGGPRLFHPGPDTHHVIFLRQEGQYLHTVGDYPSYDLEIFSRSIPAMLSAWNSGRKAGADPVDRVVDHVLRSQFETLSADELREALGGGGLVQRGYYMRGLQDLVRLAGPLFVVTQLDDVCHHSTSPSGRIAACFVTGEEFAGRCQAFDLASQIPVAGIDHRHARKRHSSCLAYNASWVGELESRILRARSFFGWSMAPEHRLKTIRVYASAMDTEVRQAACRIAAQTPETRDMPECTEGPAR